MIVRSLINPVILGLDFLHKHRINVDFSSKPITISIPDASDRNLQTFMPLFDATKKDRAKICAIEVLKEPTEETIDDCAVPLFINSLDNKYDIPSCVVPTLLPLLEQYKNLFRGSPGSTTVAEHFIPTTGTPVKVPPRRIPANYRVDVEKQIQMMLKEGIIEECSSPWLAPAVFVRKKTGDIRICVDYRELNKRTVKDAYPLPRPDEVQDRLAGSVIFSTLDLQSGYWQLPVNSSDRAKTAFSPGPGLGLFQFRRMPFGLSGAPASFQRLMDTILRDLPFVTTYLDDVLIHSASIEEHERHLKIVFDRLQSAGLTLRGGKCNIGVRQVKYLGHVFSARGMEPDSTKISAVCEWPTPTNSSDLRSFLGLASYYRRYIKCFADIASPLYQLTNKGAVFTWDKVCHSAFTQLKQKLTEAPVLIYPNFCPSADQFILLTDASATGIGAVLEQSGHVIAYASRTLSVSEKNYSVIQRECLAMVFALKQFRHYLLGRKFKLITDHAPLQWLSSQKMEGLLARWALATQEFDFTITYRKGVEHGNADALSRQCTSHKAANHNAAVGHVFQHSEELKHQQHQDPVICQLYDALLQSQVTPTGRTWSHPPLRRYRQLWSQLLLKDGLVCRQYQPGPVCELTTVPIIPSSYRQTLLLQYHSHPAAGHLGAEKTAARIRQVGYWVGMLRDIDQYCRECSVCQSSKPPSPQKAPLLSMPIGRPWQMVAVDILEVPLSFNRNRYLLVIQDYFSKWADAIPLPNQTADCITKELVKVFAIYGMPDILHSDQGRNFESSIMRQTLEAFGIKKSRTTAYHPQGDGMVERFNRSLLQMLRSYVNDQAEWERYLPFVLFAYRTAVHASTGVTPFEMMFGRAPQQPPFPQTTAYDVITYPNYLRSKLAQLTDFVETHMTEAAHKQKLCFDQHASPRTFKIGDPVWLTVPTAGKLDPKWEGDYEVQTVNGPTTYTISDGKRTKTVHVNRLRPRIQPALIAASPESKVADCWSPPSIEHRVVDVEESSTEPRYPSRERRPPDWFRPP